KPKAEANPKADGKKRIPVEHSQRTEFRGFTSNGYEPTKAEAKAEKPGVIENEHAEFNATTADVLTGKAGKRIAWCGIIREINVDKKANETRLLVEMKYFDHIVDAHIQLVSIYSAGDFTVTLPGVGYKLKPLSLVRVIGVVTKDEKDVPHVKAEYLRNWDWGHFSFMDYGKDAGNPKWAELRKVSGDDVYSPNPDDQFYEERLGKRPAEKK
ncbi:MAG: hypothetical protein WD875_12545, partial [Pirellulales bacterium]